MKAGCRIMFAAAMCAAGFQASAWEINVNTVVTDEGKRQEHPTVDHPAYYYPKVIGYSEAGSVAKGFKPPSQAETIRLVAKALASQGYLVTHTDGKICSPAPGLLLAIEWGQIAPLIGYYEYNAGGQLLGIVPEPMAIPDVFYSPAYGPGMEKRIMGLVGEDTQWAHNAHGMGEGMTIEALDQSTEGDRYFVVISAYDFNAFNAQHKMVLLWVSRMSIQRGGFDLDRVIGPLLANGAPFFGRETAKPQLVSVTELPTGRVEIGPTEFKGYLAPTTPAQAPAKK